MSNQLPEQIHHYYNRGKEAERLYQSDNGELERERTQELFLRYLPPAPATVLDVGGGAGVYALWLAKLGYQVHLIDVMPLHVEQAQTASATQLDAPLASCKVGDARQLEWADSSIDAVLLPGPLYHLTDEADRLKALSEAYRVLRKGGVVLAVAISRFASALDGMFTNRLSDPVFWQLVQRDIQNGQHRNPTSHPGYFTTAFFHHPDELRAEVQKAGFALEALLTIEGIGYFLHNFVEYWNNPALREILLTLTRHFEQEPTLLGVGPHLLAVGHKP